MRPCEGYLYGAVILTIALLAAAQSTVTCQTPGAKPVFTFDKVMVCGCVKDGAFSGPCYDGPSKVQEMEPAQAEKIARDMSTPTAPFDGQCQTMPEVFLESR